MKQICEQCKEPCKQLNVDLDDFEFKVIDGIRTKVFKWKCNRCYYENIKEGIKEIKK